MQGTTPPKRRPRRMHKAARRPRDSRAPTRIAKGPSHTCKSSHSASSNGNNHTPGDWLAAMPNRHINRMWAIYRVKYRGFQTSENSTPRTPTRQSQFRQGAAPLASVAAAVIRDKNRRHARSDRLAPVSRKSQRTITGMTGRVSVHPTAGDICPFQRLTPSQARDRNFRSAGWRICAAHPGTKMFVALVVWPQAEGAHRKESAV